MVIPPKVAPFASANRSFVRESKAREAALKGQQHPVNRSFQGRFNNSSVAPITTKELVDSNTTSTHHGFILETPGSNRSFVKQSRAKSKKQNTNQSYQGPVPPILPKENNVYAPPQISLSSSVEKNNPVYADLFAADRSFG